METLIDGVADIDSKLEIGNKTLAIRKTKKIDHPDAMIAATALGYNLTLVTRNLADFKNIEGLKLVNPWG